MTASSALATMPAFTAGPVNFFTSREVPVASGPQIHGGGAWVLAAGSAATHGGASHRAAAVAKKPMNSRACMASISGR